MTDSFAMGVPIITTADQNHGPEFSYLIDGYNSVIVLIHGASSSKRSFASLTTRTYKKLCNLVAQNL